MVTWVQGQGGHGLLGTGHQSFLLVSSGGAQEPQLTEG